MEQHAHASMQRVSSTPRAHALMPPAARFLSLRRHEAARMPRRRRRLFWRQAASMSARTQRSRRRQPFRPLMVTAAKRRIGEAQLSAPMGPRSFGDDFGMITRITLLNSSLCFLVESLVGRQRDACPPTRQKRRDAADCSPSAASAPPRRFERQGRFRHEHHTISRPEFPAYSQCARA